MKIKLPQVTLVGIDCLDLERLQVVIDLCEKEIEFGQVKILTSINSNDKRVIEIPKIKSTKEYSDFCIGRLNDYIDTDFVLIVQYDGFILNPQSWDDKFLKYDYIGSPWLVAGWSVEKYDFPKELMGTKIVGNGGFSLRSKKFLEISSKLSKENLIINKHPEDVSLCVWNRNLLEENGIKFAPSKVAELFGVEGEEWIYDKQFGFHGFQWTNIDKWIIEHPEQTSIIRQYNLVRDKSSNIN